MLGQLGWEIKATTRQTIIIADGCRDMPLEKVTNLPIRFSKLIIPMNAIIVDTTSYDLVIGNDWLTKVRDIINIDAQKIYIYWKGRYYEIPINLECGIHLELIEGNDLDM